MDSKAKKFYRDLKRSIKQKGNRKRRRAAKQDLADHPQEAHWFEEGFGKYASEWLNGLDRAPDSQANDSSGPPSKESDAETRR